MKRSIIAIAILTSLASAGCHYGMTAEKFPPSNRPEGTTARLIFNDAGYVGELLEVRDGAFLVLTRGQVRALDSPTSAVERKVRLLPFVGLRMFQFSDYLSPDRAPDGSFSKQSIDRLRLLSRFPQGLSPDLLQQLLKSCGQADLAGIKP